MEDPKHWSHRRTLYIFLKNNPCIANITQRKAEIQNHQICFQKNLTITFQVNEQPGFLAKTLITRDELRIQSQSAVLCGLASFVNVALYPGLFQIQILDWSASHWWDVKRTHRSNQKRKTLTPVIQGANRSNKGARQPIIPEDPPQDSPRGAVECLLQIHKTYVDRLAKLPGTLQDSTEGVELVQCSTSRVKTSLVLLNPRFDYPADPSLQNPWVDLPREAEECDPPMVGTHPPVSLLKKRDRYPDLPIKRYRPRWPCNVAESRQPRQPYNFQGLKELQANLIHPRGPASKEFFDHLGDLGPRDETAYPRVPGPYFLPWRHVGGIEEVFKIFRPPIHNILWHGQQRTIPAVHSVDSALAPHPQTPDVTLATLASVTKSAYH